MTTFSHLRRTAKALKFLHPCKQNVSTGLRQFLRNESSFVPKRVLIVGKFSRYFFEKLREPDLSESELKKKLLERGSDYENMVAVHNATLNIQNQVINFLKKKNIEYRVVNRQNLDQSSFTWADLILPIGGDGTFLLASNLIFDDKKPIIGINSYPERSEGFLLLAPKYTTRIPEIFEMLEAGHYRVLMRRRIRTTLHGDDIWDSPFHTHEKGRIVAGGKFYMNSEKPTSNNLPKERRLPWLALNEVFIAETLSARTSDLLIKLDDNEKHHTVKSSGLCVSTGTGSTSWYKSINSVNPQIVREIINVADEKKQFSTEEIQRICSAFNDTLHLHPEELKLCYTVRDMIVSDIWPVPKCLNSRGFCKKLTVRSQCFDGSLVLDGGIAVPFNFGVTVLLEMHPEDSLRSLVLLD
ncbi:NAD kinase 2, mitochondrial isoform X2 [Lasioglossum baleicum]|uniref:NAD kinase 2, mitochondrial isoform X2 n=1 Tax=Lasioglossum baleicum TaxID=434251 RepID=UPI003FCE4B04